MKYFVVYGLGGGGKERETETKRENDLNAIYDRTQVD